MSKSISDQLPIDIILQILDNLNEPKEFLNGLKTITSYPKLLRKRNTNKSMTDGEIQKLKIYEEFMDKKFKQIKHDHELLMKLVQDKDINYPKLNRLYKSSRISEFAKDGVRVIEIVLGQAPYTLTAFYEYRSKQQIEHYDKYRKYIMIMIENLRKKYYTNYERSSYSYGAKSKISSLFGDMYL